MSEESKHLSFDCMIDGKRCTLCCEAIHLPINMGLNIILKKKDTFPDGDWIILKHWKQISKRVAKKINPYMFGSGWSKEQKKWLNQSVLFFKCTALVDGLCTVYDQRPFACRDFAGNGMYAYECANESYEKRQSVEIVMDLKITKGDRE